MKTYNIGSKRRGIPRRIWIIALVLIALVIGGASFVQRWYYDNLLPVSTSTQKQYITIQSGSTASSIAKQLQTAGLIRSSQAFEWYVSIRAYRDKLQAG